MLPSRASRADFYAKLMTLHSWREGLFCSDRVLTVERSPAVREDKGRVLSDTFNKGLSAKFPDALCKLERHSGGQSKSSCLVERLLPFRRRAGVGNDSRACVERSFAILKNCRSDRDGELAFSVEAKIADRARIDSARMGFQLGDDFEGALFRGARDRTSGKTSSVRPPRA